MQDITYTDRELREKAGLYLCNNKTYNPHDIDSNEWIGTEKQWEKYEKLLLEAELDTRSVKGECVHNGYTLHMVKHNDTWVWCITENKTKLSFRESVKDERPFFIELYKLNFKKYDRNRGI